MRSTAFVILFLLQVLGMPLRAQSMTSTSFNNDWNVIDAGGAARASTSYQLYDSLFQTGVGSATSSSFSLYAGFQQSFDTPSATSTPTITVTQTPSITPTATQTPTATATASPSPTATATITPCALVWSSGTLVLPNGNYNYCYVSITGGTIQLGSDVAINVGGDFYAATGSFIPCPGSMRKVTP